MEWEHHPNTRVMKENMDSLRKDAERWRWLRKQGGWPDSEAAVIGATPEDFDRMADEGMNMPNVEFSGTAKRSFDGSAGTQG